MSSASTRSTLAIGHLEVASDIRFQGTASDTHVITLRGQTAPALSAVLTIPAIAANTSLLTAESTLSADKVDVAAASVVSISGTDSILISDVSDAGSTKRALVSDIIALSHTGEAIDITGATAETAIADGDEFLVYDTSATANRKITAANVKSYIGGMPAGEPAGELLASNGTDFVSVPMSGDATLASSGALSLADAVSTTSFTATVKLVAGTSIVLDGDGGADQWRFSMNAVTKALNLLYSDDTGATWTNAASWAAV